MEIRTKQSSFSQFSKGLWMIAEHEGTRIDFDVDQSELLSFAQSLVEIADVCLRKSTKDTDKLQEMAGDLIEAINTANVTGEPSRKKA